MKLLRKHTGAQSEGDAAAPTEGAAPELALAPEPEPPGPHLLSDGPLFARWFILYELEKEMRRSARHDRPLSVMVLKPVPTLGSRPSEAALIHAAESARRSARSTDLIGWLAEGGIIVIMPETDRDGANAAVDRWRNEMYVSSMRFGAVRWHVATNVYAGNFESVDALLEAIGAELRPAEAA